MGDGGHEPRGVGSLPNLERQGNGLCPKESRREHGPVVHLDRSWDGKTILDYMGGPNLVTWALKIREPFPAMSEKEDWKKKDAWQEINLLLLALKVDEEDRKPGNVDSF